ncbi:exported hypothetical protein [Vibrio nigripulchritudo SOn1]|uniref:PLD phosphodiesterase domain-containing protein n=1 Tax=Vibrio nigripulchritudo SOn1 TaxID=1238450 RepID=A0AAV2VSP5_9VIBR|nr:phospholipase D-like domain-containing protein [Vibrio nigripulchritudo]CCO47767.1 exported hypothetical protein [Vibrio nigripulchritudo SOn1]
MNIFTKLSFALPTIVISNLVTSAPSAVSQTLVPPEVFLEQHKIKIGVNDGCLVPSAIILDYAAISDCFRPDSVWTYTEFGQLIAKRQLGYECLTVPEGGGLLYMDICDINNTRQNWYTDYSRVGIRLKTGNVTLRNQAISVTSDRLLLIDPSYPLVVVQNMQEMIAKQSPGYTQFSLNIYANKPIPENHSLYPTAASNVYFGKDSELRAYKNFYNVHKNTLFSNWGDPKLYKGCYRNPVTDVTSWAWAKVVNCPFDDSIDNSLRWAFRPDPKTSGSTSLYHIEPSRFSGRLVMQNSGTNTNSGYVSGSSYSNPYKVEEFYISSPGEIVAKYYDKVGVEESDIPAQEAANENIIHDVKQYFLEEVIGDCNAQCLLRQVSKRLSRVGYSHTWHLFPVTSIEVLSSLSGRESSVADVLRNNEVYRDKVINTIKNGQHIIDLTLLARIDGSWISRLQEALRTIEINALQNGTTPVVRIYVGLGGLATGWPDYVIDIVKRKLIGQGFISESGIPETQWNTHLQGILTQLVSGLAGNTNMQVYISGGRKSFLVPESGLFDLTWNHSKIVAVDGIEAITGGHNLWEEYFSETPVIDTSVKIQGTAAYFTHKVVDKMWRTGDFRHMLKWQHGAIALADTVPYVEQLLPLPPVISGDIDVLILDQGNPRTIDGADRFDMKAGVLAMISAAQREIFLSQQSLVNPYSKSWFGAFLRDIDEELAYMLAKKSIEGVDVKVVLSNPIAPFDTTSNASNTDIIGALWTAAIDSGVKNDADSRQKFCSHFKLGNLRIDSNSETYPNTSYSFANHSKTVMIDKKLFSIGSHNVYEQRPASLIEMMYIIASEVEAEKYHQAYWAPLIAHSQRTFVSKEQCVKAITF